MIETPSLVDQHCHGVLRTELGLGTFEAHLGRTVEVGALGREGFVGMPVVFEDDAPAFDTIGQVAGKAWRMRENRGESGAMPPRGNGSVLIASGMMPDRSSAMSRMVRSFKRRKIFRRVCMKTDCLLNARSAHYSRSGICAGGQLPPLREVRCVPRLQMSSSRR